MMMAFFLYIYFPFVCFFNGSQKQRESDLYFYVWTLRFLYG